MEKKNIENNEAFKKIIEAQTGSVEFDAMLEEIESNTKVKEVVGESVGEDIKPSGRSGDDNKSKTRFAGISERISRLLGAKKSHMIVLPPKKVQQKQIVKALSAEVRRLVKESHKIQNSRQYSPAKLEELLIKIRGIQKMISEVFHLAANTLTDWYNKFVIKKS